VEFTLDDAEAGAESKIVGVGKEKQELIGLLGHEEIWDGPEAKDFRVYPYSKVLNELGAGRIWSRHLELVSNSVFKGYLSNRRYNNPMAGTPSMMEVNRGETCQRGSNC
jgi:hypothetical protein